MLGAMRRRAVRRTLQSLIALLVVAGVWTLIALLSVRDDLESAQDAIAAAQDSGDVDQSGPLLAAAEEGLARASGRLRAPGPTVVAWLPLVGRPVQGIERTATAGLAVVRSTRQVIAAAKPAGGSLVVDGGVQIAGLRSLAAALEDAEQRTREPVAALLSQRTSGVIGVVRGPVREAQRELAGVPDAFGRAASSVRALTGVLGGDEPRQLLLVLENNAELRGTGGIVTVFAEAVADGGRVDVGRFRDVEDVADDESEAKRVDSPPDYHRLWGRYLADTTLWKNVNMAPDVPTSSVVLSNIVDRSIGRRPTAVVWLDVRAIEKVLEATGPATLPDGTRLTAGNAVRTLLSDAYRTAPDTRAGQAARRAQLRGVADAVLDKILGGEASATKLGLALADAARGRHLALWSAENKEQGDLVAGGLAGEVAAGAGGDLTSFVVQNFGGGDGEGNKLDYYARRQVSTSVVVGRRTAVVRQEVSLRNTAPRTGLPRYVAGFATPGILNSLVTFALPSGAGLLEFSRAGVPVRTEVLPEGDHQVVSDTTELASGTTATWVLRYEIPLRDGHYRLTAFPQPLAVDGGLALDIRAADGLELRSTVPGALRGGEVRYTGPFADRRVVEVHAVRPGLLQRSLDRAKRFWDSPLGG